MLRQPFVDCGGLVNPEPRRAAAFKPAASPWIRAKALIFCADAPLPLGALGPPPLTSPLHSPKNFLATCTSSVPPLSCAHLIPLVSYAVTATQPYFPTRNCFSRLAF